MNEPINIIFQVQNFPYPIAVSVTVRYITKRSRDWLYIVYTLKSVIQLLPRLVRYIKTLP